MSHKRKPQKRLETANPNKPATSILSNRKTYKEEFKPDYSHVIKDLRRIGTLAGSFLVILVVLSFFLR